MRHDQTTTDRQRLVALAQARQSMISTRKHYESVSKLLKRPGRDGLTVDIIRK